MKKRSFVLCFEIEIQPKLNLKQSVLPVHIAKSRPRGTNESSPFHCGVVCRMINTFLPVICCLFDSVLIL